MAKPGYRLALVATLLAVVVVLLGAYTRLTHAGLGCPDWPGCYGFLAVPMSEQAQSLAALRFPDAPVEVHKGWNERVHRYVAGALGLVILALAVAGGEVGTGHCGVVAADPTAQRDLGDHHQQTEQRQGSDPGRDGPDGRAVP